MGWSILKTFLYKKAYCIRKGFTLIIQMAIWIVSEQRALTIDCIPLVVIINEILMLQFYFLHFLFLHFNECSCFFWVVYTTEPLFRDILGHNHSIFMENLRTSMTCWSQNTLTINKFLFYLTHPFLNISLQKAKKILIYHLKFGISQ